MESIVIAALAIAVGFVAGIYWSARQFGRSLKHYEVTGSISKELALKIADLKPPPSAGL